MSRKVQADSELQKISIDSSSPNDQEEENLPFLKMAVGNSCLDEASKSAHATNATTTTTYGTKFSISAQNSIANPSLEKKKIEKTHSGPVSISRIPSFRLSTPNSLGYTRVSYANEKKLEHKRVEKQSSTTPPQKRESSSIFSRSSKASIKHSPLLRLNREEKKNIQASSNKLPNEHQYIRTRNLSPEGVSRIRGIVALRNLRGGYLSPLRLMDRPTQHHTFPTDDTDVREIEKKLLQLMEDFEAGNLRAFGKDSRLRQMEEIREQQERLAKLHFEVGADQELYSPLSEDGLKNAEDNMKKLMNKLAHLSESIENLHSNTHIERKPSSTERKVSSSAINPLSTSSSMDVTTQSSPFESSGFQTHTPFILHHNPNKGLHSPPPPPPLPSQPPLNSSAKDQKSSCPPTASSSKLTPNAILKKSSAKFPVEDNSSQLLTSPVTANAQQKPLCSLSPAISSTANMQPAKHISSHKVPSSAQGSHPISALDSEFSQKLKSTSQSCQAVSKKLNGES